MLKLFIFLSLFSLVGCSQESKDLLEDILSRKMCVVTDSGLDKVACVEYENDYSGNAETDCANQVSNFSSYDAVAYDLDEGIIACSSDNLRGTCKLTNQEIKIYKMLDATEAESMCDNQFHGDFVLAP